MNEDEFTTTKTFALTPKEYFGIIFKGSSRWHFAALFFGGLLGYIPLPLILYLASGKTAAIIGFLYLVLMFRSNIFWCVWQTWRSVHNKENALLYVPVTCEFNREYLISRDEQGNESKRRFASIIRVTTAKKHYLLYLSKCQFIYMPFDAFLSGADRERFEACFGKHFIDNYIDNYLATLTRSKG